jgi:signal transduction histidine kinase
VLERLAHFYSADLGLLIMSDGHGHYSIYRVESQVSTTAQREEIADALSAELLALPSTLAVCYNRQRGWWRRSASRIQSFDARGDQPTDDLRPVIEALADTLDAKSFISVPTFRHNEASGRIYFSKSSRGTFNLSDVDFLLNVMKHANPIIENIRLVDNLASDAAERERHRIARDIHDSIIQPYIGFQIALSGLRRRIDAGQTDVAAEIQQLSDMTALGVADLRRYVSKLKNSGEEQTTLLPAIERFAKKFSDATGITVNISSSSELATDDRLAAEIFQLVTEGLSNIRKHTDAAQAVVKIVSENKRLIVSIENDGSPESNGEELFTPKSITERALSLNGFAQVEQTATGTKVRVEIPL